MNDQYLDLVKAVHRKAIEQQSSKPARSLNEATIHHTELPDISPDCLYYLEWQTYRREVAGLIRNHLAGLYVAIKGDAIVGFYPSARIAMLALAQDAGSVLLIKILRDEPLWRLQGIQEWLRSPSPLAKTA